MKLAPFDFQNENYHMGHIFMDTMKSRPDAICQIDAATGESETYASVLSRSIQLARCFRNFGLKPGDILALGGRNHLDIHIPYYAALMNGMPIAGVDPLFKYNQIRSVLKVCTPRVAFCQQELLEDYLRAVEELGLNTEIICFDVGEYSMAKFIEKYGDKEATEEFLPAIFDLNKIYAWLVSTSGTTGIIKFAAFKHKQILAKIGQLKAIFASQERIMNEIKLNGENVPNLNLVPVHTISAFFIPVSWPINYQIKIQSSAPHTTEHKIDIINKYKPKSVFMCPSIVTSILKSEKKCDFSCLKCLVVTGDKVNKDIYIQIRKLLRPNATFMELYGQTENLGPILVWDPKGPFASCGRALPTLPVKLVDPETGKEITEPNVPGELWTKGIHLIEYYNNPEETAAVFSEDGWFKTGDLLYRDENGYFFFVERLKMLIKYRSYHISSPEIEAVIREHPAVLDVSITSVPSREDGQHVVACVETRPGSKVTAEEIKNLVASKLSDSHRLRGGVVFMKLPMTSAGKVARGELRQMVLTAHRE